MEKLTDKRRTYTFSVDDAVLDIFGPQIGAYGVAVYALLARHAKKKQSFPSYATMQKKLGMSRRGVIYAIQRLVKVGLVQKEARTSDDGDPTSNLYILVDLSAYHDHPTCDDGGSAYGALPGAQNALPGAQDAPGVVHMVHQGGAYGAPEGISLKGSHLKERERETPPPPARRCPVGYEPTEAVRQWAQEKYPAVDFEDALAAMRDCEFKQAHRDWHAVMRNWIRREAKWTSERTSNGTRLTREEQRAVADKQSTQELEDLVYGRNTRFSVWAPLGRDGAGVPGIPRRGSQGRLSHGTG